MSPLDRHQPALRFAPPGKSLPAGFLAASPFFLAASFQLYYRHAHLALAVHAGALALYKAQPPQVLLHRGPQYAGPLAVMLEDVLQKEGEK